MVKPDISSRKDIQFIVTKFYDKLTTDELTFPFFKDFIKENTLEHHLEIITDFWEDIVFQTYSYKNNPMQKHLDFAKKIPFSKEHFSVWLSYFQNTIDEFFEGNNAELMKNRAQSIATVMQIKLNLFKK